MQSDAGQPEHRQELLRRHIGVGRPGSGPHGPRAITPARLQRRDSVAAHLLAKDLSELDPGDRLEIGDIAWRGTDVIQTQLRYVCLPRPTAIQSSDKTRAKIAVRPASRQDPEHAIAALQDHIRSVACPGVRVAFEGIGGGSPATTAGPGRDARAAAGLAARPGACPPRRDGPDHRDLQGALDMDTLMFGLNLPDEDFHAPKEFFHVDSIALRLRNA